MTFGGSGDISVAPGYLSQDDFHSLMDKTFGAGKWRETGGFRSQARENALRMTGAQTVGSGAVSSHSLGSTEAPGAHDVVVDGLTPSQVAKQLAAAAPGVRDVFPEGSAGGQGAHLHVGMAANAAPATFGSAKDETIPATYGSAHDAPVDSRGNPAARVGESFLGGVVSGAGKLLKSGAELADAAEQRFGLIPPGAKLSEVAPVAQITAPASTALRSAGDKIAPNNRSGLESFAHGAGEMVPALGAAVVDPALGAVAFGAGGYGESHDEALAKGATEETAQTAGLENAGVQGVLGALPIGELAAPLTAGLDGLKGLAARVGVAAVSDAGLGAAMQTGTNLVAKQNYDPNRAWYDQVPQSAAMMAGGGLLVHGAHDAIGAVKGALRPPEIPPPSAEPGAPAPAPTAGAGEMPATDAIRAYAGHGPVDEAAPSGEPPAEAGAPAEAAPAPPSGTGRAAAPIVEGEPVLFNTADGIAHGHVEATVPGESGAPDSLLVRTPAGHAVTTSANAVALPAAYERARVAEGAPLEQMPQAISDVSELRQAAPKNYSLLQAIRDLGGIRTKDAQGQPDSDIAGALDGVRTQPGVVNNQTGLSPDAMREALQERGWFGEQTDSAVAGDAKPGDSVEDLARLMTTEASGRANRIYHPTVADQELRRGDLEEQMTRAGVGADEPLPEAAAKLAAWRAEQVRAEGPEMERLHQRAEELGEKGLAHATYDETLADVVEAEAVHGDASEDDADHYENLIDADITPDEHEWLASTRQGAHGEPEPAFPLEGARESPGLGAGAAESHLEPSESPSGGGENPGEGSAPLTDALSEPQQLGGQTVQQNLIPGTERSAQQTAQARPALMRSSADQIGPDGLFAPAEPQAGNLFETAQAETPNGASFLAKPRNFDAKQMREMLPLAQRYGGRYAMGRANTSFQFRTAEARDAFMKEATDGGTKFARAPVFYSAVERLVDRSPMKAASPEQWKATLKNAPGIKQEELQWTGVGDWLDLFPKGEKVPKEKLRAFLHDNGVQVEEKVLGAPALNKESPYYGRQVARVLERAQDLMLELENDAAAYEEIFTMNPQLDPDSDWARTVLDSVAPDWQHGTQYNDWTLPGGQNYRELLLTLPKEASPPATHWDTPGVMAHVRFDERRAPDGKKVLMVQEIQSDWHQKGRDQGYAQATDPARIKQTKAAADDAVAALREHARPFLDHVEERLDHRISELAAESGRYRDQGAHNLAATAAEQINRLRDARSHIYRGYSGDGDAAVEETLSRLMRSPIWGNSDADIGDLHGPKREAERLQLAVSEAKQEHSRARDPGGIPDAPFKSTWPNLVMKRIIRWAVDQYVPPSASYAEATKPDSARVVADDFFGRGEGSVPPLDAVQTGVVAALKYDQIREAVAANLPVDVVNDLPGGERAAQRFLRNPRVVIDALPVAKRARVLDGLREALSSVGARLRAELSMARKTGSDFEFLPALKVSELDPRVVVGLLAPETLYHDAAAGGAVVGREAGAGAEPSALGLGGVGQGHLTPTALADFLNWHESIRGGTGHSYQAADGIQRVAWTSGEQQAERYDLTRHINRVELHDNSSGGVGRPHMEGPFERGRLIAHGQGVGRRVIDSQVNDRAEIDELLGKELAEKLMNAEPHEGIYAGLGTRVRTLEGLDVKTGGEGMKAFYDRNLVNITNDLIKKHGGKVETVKIESPDLKRAREDVTEAAGLVAKSQLRTEQGGLPSGANRRASFEAAKARVAELEKGQDQAGFDITPELRAAVEGGQPLFKRGEGAPAGEQATSGVILPGMPRGLSMRRYDNPTIAQTALINQVHDAIAKIAPFAEMHPAASMHDEGYGEVLGFSHRSGLRHLIAWSLDAPGIARHEAVHALKEAGTFRPEEWGALVHAAQTEGWVDEFNVPSRYHDLNISGQIEEAFADKFAQFDQDGRKGMTGLAGAAMRKIGQAIDRVRDLVRQFRKLNPDWRDVFSRMERGELGARFGDDLRDVGAPDQSDPRFARSPRAAERDARQAAAQREIDEREGRAPTVVTRLLGNGVDAVGNRATEALERFLPESVQDISQEVRMAVNPMAAGSERAQAEAKDFANGLREIAYSHGKVDEWLAKTFTPEQRREMYDAADEERVIRGRGDEPTVGQGKSRLPPPLRKVVDQLQARADEAFKRAQELGMVKGEGQESYVPAMLVDVSGGIVSRLKGGKGATGGRGNLTTSSGSLRQRKYATAEETQAAAQRGFGEGATVVHDIRTLNLATGKLEQAMAGRRLINKIKEIGRQVGEVTVSDGAMPEANAYFTMPDHPAMVTWGPKFEKDQATGKMVPIEGADGKPVMEAKPLYIAKEFEGPLRAVLSRPDAQLWRKLMDVKGKMMSVTMYNPLLHNMVIYGKAFPAMVAHDKLGAFTFKTYRDGALVKRDPELMSRALQSGTVPIGHQAAFQDITSIANEDPITPGKSWTAQLLAATLGMGSPERKLAIKRGVDKAGDVWHNAFLWNRVSDLQMGLWKAMSDHFQKQGLDQVTADRSASYFANMYAGSVPVEAMSRLARGLLNGVLFSRSFHVTNIGGMKAMIAGLPTDVQAQIMRDAPAMLAKAQGLVRSKAIGSLVTDFIAAWAGRMIAAGALAWLLNRAFQAPGDNEEGKKDRVFVGYGPDGTASYMRLPFGKYVEEVKDWFTEPVTYAKQIMFGPTRLALQYLSNDMGFGRKAYDPYDKSLEGLGKNLWKFVGNLGSSFLPIDHGQQLWDAATKHGQAQDDAAAALAGDLTGFTISHGAPGGPAVGDIFRAQDEHNYRVTEAMPEIRKQIKAGDIVGARAKMAELGVPPGLQAYYVKVARNPNARMTGRKLADFNRIATPEQKAEFQRDRAAAALRGEESTH